jgi:BirA family transcriptional regulator, biotin operon repressor / biotin---[acetyl-CoA-carboxylase] ligase
VSHGQPGRRFGRPRRDLEVTGSTNADALAWAERDAPEGALVVAEHQTAGRGRWGRRWESVPGGSLLFSLVLRPQRPAHELALLTTALGVAVAEGVEESCGLECRLKWPNDVSVSGRKLAGVLVETRFAGDPSSPRPRRGDSSSPRPRRGDSATVSVAVAGVGVNLDWPNVPAELADRATSVGAELRRLGRPAAVDRDAALEAILVRFELLYPAVLESPRDVLDSAAARSEILGRDVTIRMADGSILEGRAARLLAGGELEVASAAGAVTVEAGEIERVRAR